VIDGTSVSRPAVKPSGAGIISLLIEPTDARPGSWGSGAPRGRCCSSVVTPGILCTRRRRSGRLGHRRSEPLDTAMPEKHSLVDEFGRGMVGRRRRTWLMFYGAFSRGAVTVSAVVSAVRACPSSLTASTPSYGTTTGQRKVGCESHEGFRQDGKTHPAAGQNAPAAFLRAWLCCRRRRARYRLLQRRP